MKIIKLSSEEENEILVGLFISYYGVRLVIANDVDQISVILHYKDYDENSSYVLQGAVEELVYVREIIL